MIGTFGRYVIGGFTATIAHILVLMFLVERFAVDPSIATSIGFCIAVFINYYFQYYWTFAAKGSHAKIFPRYVVVTFAMLGVNLALFWILTHLFQVQYVHAQLMATAVIIFCNFAINKSYTFNQTVT